MKFDALQKDFSAGEVTPKQQGNIGTDIYQAALSRMANVVPGRVRTAASRAGGEFKAESYLSLGSGEASPTINLPVHDGPYGDFVIEINNQPGFTGDVRLRDKYGQLTWHPPIDVSLPDENDYLGGVLLPSGGGESHYDTATRTLTIANYEGSASRSILLGSFSNVIGLPAGTNESWNFDYNLAGSSITLRVTGALGTTADYPLTRGAGRVNFGVVDGGVYGPFTLTLISPNAVATESVMWGMRLTKHAMKMSLGSCPFADLSKVRASQGFWANDQFWVVVTGGPQIYTLRWTKNTGPLDTVWEFVPMAFWNPPRWNPGGVYQAGDQVADAAAANLGIDYPNVLSPLFSVWECITAGVAGATHAGNAPGDSGVAVHTGAVYQDPAAGGPKWQWVQSVDATYKTTFPPQSVQPDFDQATVRAVAVYQSRLFLGLDDSQASLLSTAVGFGGKPFSAQPWVAGGVPVILGDWRSNAGNIYNCTQAGNTGAAPGPTGTGAGLVDGTAKWDFLFSLDQSFRFKFAHQHLVQQASDSLDLKLASPTGKICWMNVLKGLVLGTTRMEKQLQGVIGIDPVTGTSPDLLDHSSVGSDEKLPALSVNQKIVFVQRGRQIVRTASVRFNWESGEPQSGLISDDVGALGEHLTKARIRSFCFLKAPVPRFVFAFDDGTGAIATPPTNNLVEMAWSRFTIPAALGGIYSVASLDADTGSQLWVGTDSGVSLCYDSFESDILPNKTYVSSPTGHTIPLTVTAYDTETPRPPVMDGWTRLALFRAGNNLALNGVNGGFGVTGRVVISHSLVGQQVYVMLTGQVYGPFTVIDTGGGNYQLQNAWLAIPPGLSSDGFTRIGADGFVHAAICYVGLAYPEHRIVTLPLEGGNSAGTSQAYTSRRVQCYLRLVDSYLPLVDGLRAAEREGADPTNLLGGRVTGDVRVTQLGFQRGETLEVKMDLPLRMEISAIFGGTQVNSP